MGEDQNTTLEQQLALIKALADRPLTLPPIFVDITGSHLAGLLLKQCIYWTQKNLEKNPASDGWFFVNLPKLQRQLRMGEHALRDARKNLESKTFLKSERRGVPPILYLWVDLGKVLEAVNLQLRQNGGIDSAVPQKSQNGEITPPKRRNNPDKTAELIPPNGRNPNKEEETKEQETLKKTQGEEIPAPAPAKPLSTTDGIHYSRWRQQMTPLENQWVQQNPGASSMPSDVWVGMAERAAERAGCPRATLRRILKREFPHDPNIDRIGQQLEIAL